MTIRNPWTLPASVAGTTRIGPLLSRATVKLDLPTSSPRHTGGALATASARRGGGEADAAWIDLTVGCQLLILAPAGFWRLVVSGSGQKKIAPGV